MPGSINNSGYSIQPPFNPGYIEQENPNALGNQALRQSLTSVHRSFFCCLGPGKDFDTYHKPIVDFTGEVVEYGTFFGPTGDRYLPEVEVLDQDAPLLPTVLDPMRFEQDLKDACVEKLFALNGEADAKKLARYYLQSRNDTIKKTVQHFALVYEAVMLYANWQKDSKFGRKMQNHAKDYIAHLLSGRDPLRNSDAFRDTSTMRDLHEKAEDLIFTRVGNNPQALATAVMLGPVTTFIVNYVQQQMGNKLLSEQTRKYIIALTNPYTIQDMQRIRGLMRPGTRTIFNLSMDIKQICHLPEYLRDFKRP